MVKLNYKTISYKDLTIHYAKYRKNRNIRLSIDNGGLIRITCPYYVSNEDIFDFIVEKESWIRNMLSKVDNTTNLSSLPALRKPQKETLLLRISNFVEKYETLLNTRVNKVSLRKMKTVWGSCSFREKTIRFNSLLYYMSDYFLEYIVLHEITHIFVHNHSKEFYRIVETYMPDYKKRWAEHKKVSL